MSTFALIMISAMISGAAFGSTCVTLCNSKAEARKISAKYRNLFIKSFPILAGFTLITLVTAFLFFFITTLKSHSSNSISKLMDIEFALKDIIIPFIIMVAISLPPSLKNYKNASIELKNNYPFLIISVFLMSIFDSLTLSLIISLITKR